MMNAILLFWIFGAFAQPIAQSASDPLAVPAGMMICKPTMPADADAADVMVTIIDGDIEQREIVAAYSDAGKPLHMAITTRSADLQRSIITEKIAIRFGGAATSVKTRLDDRSARPSPGSPIDLTEAQQKQALRLAKWLWERRCK